MRRLALLIAVIALAGVLAAPASSQAWVSGGLGIGYAGPYPYPYPYPYPPPYYPPPYYPPAYYYPPPFAYWPSYGPEIAVRWNRYFDPQYPRIQGYTLPR